MVVFKGWKLVFPVMASAMLAAFPAQLRAAEEEDSSQGWVGALASQPCTGSLFTKPSTSLYNLAELRKGLRETSENITAFSSSTHSKAVEDSKQYVNQLRKNNPTLIADDNELQFATASILLNGLEAKWGQSESTRTQCVSVMSGISAVALGVAAIVQAKAGNASLYTWTVLGLAPIVGLDVSGTTNSIPLYRDSAEGLRTLHNRYIDMRDGLRSANFASKYNFVFESRVTAMERKTSKTTETTDTRYLPVPPELPAQDVTIASNCPSTVDAAKRATSDALSVSRSEKLSLEKSLSNSTLQDLDALCAAYSEAKEALVEWTDAADVARQRLPALMARDALYLDYEVYRRERLSRPAPHEVVGALVDAPFNALSSAFGGGTAYHYPSAGGYWSDKELTLRLSSLALPALPAAIKTNWDIPKSLETLRQALDTDQGKASAAADAAKAVAAAAAKKKKHAGKKSEPPPVSPDTLAETGASGSCPENDDGSCQARALAGAVDALRYNVIVARALNASARELNRKLALARAAQARFAAANDMSVLTIRIGRIIDPVVIGRADGTSAPAPATLAAPGTPAAASTNAKS